MNLPPSRDRGERSFTIPSVLREAGEPMAVNDSWIAATAIAMGVRVVTQDRHIPEVAGLSVIHV
jgi:predicted nucleic acid-binding protein